MSSRSPSRPGRTKAIRAASSGGALPSPRGALAYYGAYLVRWDPSELSAELGYFRSSLLVVVVTKLLTFVLGGIYGPRWHHFSLDDGLRVVRATLLGTLFAAAALLLLDRLGLSRGVVVIDFLLCTLLITGSRLLFRFLEGATGRWSRGGTPVVVLGPVDEADLVVRQLRSLKEPDLRPVAVADPGFACLRSQMGAYPMYGGPGALENALHDPHANAVMVIGDWTGDAPLALSTESFPSLTAYLESRGSLDVFRIRVTVEVAGE